MHEFIYEFMDTNSAIFTLFSMTASALLLNSNCGIRGARQAQLAAKLVADKLVLIEFLQFRLYRKSVLFGES